MILSADKFLIVVGGAPVNDHVELLSLTEGLSVPECYQNMLPIPGGGSALAAGGLVTGR